MKAQRHSPTSIDAALAIELGASHLRSKVLRLLRRSLYGLTDEEMQLALDMNPSTQRPRRLELREKVLVRDSGLVRPTLSGRYAVVWRSTI